MQLLKSSAILALAILSANALPAADRAAAEQRGLLDDIQITDDLIIFDSPAFPDPNNPGNTLVQLQSFASLRQIDLGVVSSAVSAFLGTLGVDVGDSLNTLQERIRLLGAIGLPGKSATISVSGCVNEVETGETSGLPNLGMSIATASLGDCGSATELTGTASLTFLDNRKISGSIFASPDSGFGVISDIDDTVKISNVLDTLELIKSTLLDEPKAVPGMPELYTSLAASLNKPQFVYITGSPFQLFPFLNDFLDSAYSTAKGPIFTQNLTVIDPVQAIQFITNSNTQAYKVSQIDRLQAMYPNKKWLAIGDSTQKDPEVYAEAFNKGVAISCAWIRQVEGADNSAERFATAFAGVPPDKFRVFTDAEIPALANIEVAGGEC
ncbi:unnamed protein product [Cyclocybe aegerita]|uniref:Phosphatidate phosphatase APP1 catalytic domain-containing protein n=1 Tax=Cyclocybe aegerita TaxID=1973307 RepID=A0A8S0WAL7_CYCAE|nr:unnamed protein product [Cyclocybe aegerita]